MLHCVVRRDVGIGFRRGGRALVAVGLSWVILPAACDRAPTSPTPPTAARADTFLTFASKPGDGIGKGQSREFNSNNASFVVVTDQNELVMDVRESSGTFWHLELASAPGVRLAPGTYEVREPTSPYFRSGPYLSFSGNGWGCTPIGRFTIRTAMFDSAHVVSRFYATFEQRCPESPEGLSGEVQIVNDGSTSAGPIPNIAGVWSGRMETSEGFMPTQVTLSQSGALVIGSWVATSAGWSGMIDGRVAQGAFTGTVTFSGNFPIYMGSPCGASSVVSAFVADRMRELTLASRQFTGSCRALPSFLRWVLQERQ